MREKGVTHVSILWLTAVIVFGVIEAATAQLVSIWLAGGAVCALISSLCGADTTVQAIIFVAVSAILLIFTRPIVRRLTKDKKTATNADSLIGKTAVITRTVDPINGGEAKADGKYWTVCSAYGAKIEEGTVVRIERIEGVKLIVVALQTETAAQ